MTAICGFLDPETTPERTGEATRRLARFLGQAPVERCDCPQGAIVAYQPITTTAATPTACASHSGLSVAVAATLDNAKELADEVGLSPSADNASLVAALYLRHGHDLLDRLRGAFSCAIWDDDQATLLLATDPFGIRPLYYTDTNGPFAFGSQIGALRVLLDRSFSLDAQAIHHYLFFNIVPTPLSIFSGIRKLPPGHLLRIKDSHPRVERYWQLRYGEDLNGVEPCASPIRDHLKRAVEQQVTASDGTVGAFLSGGTDSSVIAGILRQCQNAPPKTFSIGFDEQDFDELSYARLASQHFGTEHNEYIVTPDDCLEVLPRLVEAFDEPFGNASAVAAHFCARLARSHGVDTLLAGDGGDELFAGNTRYVTEKIFDLYHLVPALLRDGLIDPTLRSIRQWPLPLVEKAAKYARRASLPQPQRFFSYNLFYTLAPSPILAPDFLDSIDGDEPIDLARNLYESAEDASPLNRLLELDLRLCITDNDLRKVNQASALAGVDVRYPMLDRELAEHSGRIPASLKVRAFRERWIFKRAFRDFLPEAILNKPKHGFGVPVSRWLRDAPKLAELARDTLLSQKAGERGYYAPGFIEQLFELHREDTTNFYGDRLWTSLMLELWHCNQEQTTQP